jgi:hypothetical protein
MGTFKPSAPDGLSKSLGGGTLPPASLNANTLHGGNDLYSTAPVENNTLKAGVAHAVGCTNSFAESGTVSDSEWRYLSPHVIGY